MKNLRILRNSLIVLVFQLLFYGCYSSQTKRTNMDGININQIVDSYIDFYSKKKKDFNSKEKYLILNVSEDSNSKEIDINIFDNCYQCPGTQNADKTIVLYKGYKVAIFADNLENKKALLKNFKNISKGVSFSSPPYNENVTYNFPRRWRIVYDINGKIIFFCNSILSELQETKNMLKLDSDMDDCNLGVN